MYRPAGAAAGVGSATGVGAGVGAGAGVLAGVVAGADTATVLAGWGVACGMLFGVLLVASVAAEVETVVLDACATTGAPIVSGAALEGDAVRAYTANPAMVSSARSSFGAVFIGEYGSA